ncbi:PREDICTED: protein FAF-like, chloroplastic [Nicotiana attenuata]|uniref:Protein faf-like, chloroplastic n=1 Tax=Nicotiana attenuata TaxID=49451 RepID=A0A314LFE1_NICAT|nr:PREDICTED: protein FAF-like, chloroplastic [Nicotiana attenuata]OIT39294.1 protein faf-like, chloroplastic [Nicotiana attenuata]
MSAQCVNMNKVNLSLKMEEKQGIMSILGPNTDQRSIKAATSIRRTLSADMSSISKICDSSSSSSSSDGEEEQLKDEPNRTFDWSSILSSKNEEADSSKIPPPYIHPLVKTSGSCLSKKSLEICTESLGSETGSDCFSSSPPKNEDLEVDHHYQHQQQHSSVLQSFEDIPVVKYNYSKNSSSPKSFPPPLPSVHMQSLRQNGRLILEAVSVPPMNYFHAQRVDGCLRLTYINQNDCAADEPELEMADQVEEFEQVFDNIGVMEKSSRLSNEVINVNKSSALILEKKNQLTWSKCVSFSVTPGYYDLSNKFNNSLNSMMEHEVKDSIFRECYTCPSTINQSPPPPAAAASLNAYDYFWRKKPTVANIVNNSSTADQCSKNNYYKQFVAVAAANGTDLKASGTTKIAAYEQQQDLVLIRGNKASMNNLVPLLRSCKEPKRSLIIWEPYCIATS